MSAVTNIIIYAKTESKILEYYFDEALNEVSWAKELLVDKVGRELNGENFGKNHIFSIAIDWTEGKEVNGLRIDTTAFHTENHKSDFEIIYRFDKPMDFNEIEAVTFNQTFISKIK